MALAQNLAWHTTNPGSLVAFIALRVSAVANATLVPNTIEEAMNWYTDVFEICETNADIQQADFKTQVTR